MADLKASLCGELPNQDSAIPQEQLRALLERRGIVGDPDIPNAKARLAEQELRRNMYHNTQVMLDPKADSLGVGVVRYEGVTYCYLFVGMSGTINPYA